MAVPRGTAAANDNIRQRLAANDNTTTGAVARNFSYTSNAYQITGITDTAPGTHPWLSQTWSFTHDASDRLLTGNGTIAGNHSYSLDKLDNATSFAGVTGTYNNLNQISTFNAQTYTYDANGNLASDGTRTYTFDAADRLKTVTQGATTVTFAYDGLGRRLKQTVGATETRYLWCGIAICQQRSGSDTAEKRFYSESEYVHSGTKKYLTLTDHLGSVRDVIDITGTPTLVGSFDYRPYGGVARSWGTVTPFYQYAQLARQTDTGLYLSATRAYDPANGRWINRDAIADWGYGYVGGNPVNFSDRRGLATDPACLARYVVAGAACGIAAGAGIAISTPGGPLVIGPAMGIGGEFGSYLGGAAGVLMCSKKSDEITTPPSAPSEVDGGAVADPIPDDVWDKCHEICIPESEGTWPPQDRPGVYRKCMRECLAGAGYENY